VESASHIPSVIEWRFRDDAGELEATVGCRIAGFTVHHPEPEKVQEIYDALETPMTVLSGERPYHLRLELDSPADGLVLS